MYIIFFLIYIYLYLILITCEFLRPDMLKCCGPDLHTLRNVCDDWLEICWTDMGPAWFHATYRSFFVVLLCITIVWCRLCSVCLWWIGYKHIHGAHWISWQVSPKSQAMDSVFRRENKEMMGRWYAEMLGCARGAAADGNRWNLYHLLARRASGGCWLFENFWKCYRG